MILRSLLPIRPACDPPESEYNGWNFNPDVSAGATIRKRLKKGGAMMNIIPENYVKQVISFQKTTFENSFAAVDMLQVQAEQMFSSAWRQAP
jgi:hypothetical protein